MSLRTRLLIAVGAVAVLALVAADVATYSALRAFLISRLDQTLATSQGPLAHTLAGPPSESHDRAEHPVADALAAIAPGSFVQVRRPSGAAVAADTQAAVLPGGKRYSPVVARRIAGLQPAAGPAEHPVLHPVYFTAASREKGGPWFRVSASLLPDGRQLLVATPLTTTQATINRLVAVEAAVTAAALVVAMLLGWWLVRVGLRPLRRMEGTAEAIAGGELQQRVPGEDERTEVGRLARALNVMLGRIEAAFAARDATEAELRESEQRLRQFVADASHELRTPLAAVSAYAELLDSGAVEKGADLHHILAGMRGETSRMGAMVEDLLLLARLDEGRPLVFTDVELVGLLAECLQTSRAVGPEWPVRLDASRPVEVRGDRERLRQVFSNLLANVRAHTPPGTHTVVRLSEQDQAAVVDVEDDAPRGLTKDQAAHVFERFYRADPSRSHEHGGAGLGLSIVAAVVAAHDGNVSAAPGRQGGSRFTVRLPLAQPGESSSPRPAALEDEAA